MGVSEGALDAPSDGRNAGGAGGLPVERSRHCEPESPFEGGGALPVLPLRDSLPSLKGKWS